MLNRSTGSFIDQSTTWRDHGILIVFKARSIYCDPPKKSLSRDKALMWAFREYWRLASASAGAEPRAIFESGCRCTADFLL